MTPVYKLSASSVTGRTNYGSMLAGNPAFEFPGSFVPIATVTVGGTSQNSIIFSSIPATYAHLQIRASAKDTQPSHTDDGIYMYLNDDTGANYTRHSIVGDGATVMAYGAASTSIAAVGQSATSNGAQNNVFAPNVIDILDYANTNKYKTTRTLNGFDNNNNGSVDFDKGIVGISSGLWQSTSAINTITLFCAGNWSQYTQFALYGVKA